MSDLVGNLEVRYSRIAAQIVHGVVLHFFSINNHYSLTSWTNFQEPFCLYPGEVLVDAEKFGSGTGSAICNEFKKAIKPQPVIKANSALRLKALLDFTDDEGRKHYAGDMWQLEGPLLYYPTPNAVSYM